MSRGAGGESFAARTREEATTILTLPPTPYPLPLPLTVRTREEATTIERLSVLVTA